MSLLNRPDNPCHGCVSMLQDKELTLQLIINACNEYQINVTKSIRF